MKIILASKSGVRRDILNKYGFQVIISPSNVDEDQVKEALQEKGADPEIISKNLAELKSIKVSVKYPDEIVIGADSVVSLNSKLINKPASRVEALNILKMLNGQKHYLISSVCISKNGSMIWNYTDKSELKMKNLSDKDLNSYLKKIKTETLLAYGVYQIEAGGLSLFEYVKGDKDSIMGLPIKQIKEYLKNLKNE
tara:strand:- start:613 stop:1200 length:588 start_codon:yes stop_codon:yes gene_type:complete